MLRTAPAVFAVGNEYQIMVMSDKKCMMWVKIGDELFYDESNGILCSGKPIHRMKVPQKYLDEHKEYTICECPMKKRRAYFSVTGKVTEYTYEFRPVPKQLPIRTYQIADSHSNTEFSVKAAKNYGNIDFLILNGDVPNDSDKFENFDTIYEICASMTNGNIPIVFSRGNHDTRGRCAEYLEDYTPVENGNSYFTFRIGCIWGMVLDCAEDKLDDNPEYGGTVACHSFRKRQIDFIDDVIKNADREYLADGVEKRVIISHHPFTHVLWPPFDIEQDIYSVWAKKIKESIKPNLMIHGHIHTLGIYEAGSDYDNLGQPCRIVVGSKPEKENFTGCGVLFEDGNDTITFTDINGDVELTE